MRRKKGGESARELPLSSIHQYQPSFVLFFYVVNIFFPILQTFSHQFQALHFLYFRPLLNGNNISKYKLYRRNKYNCTVMHISKNKLYRRNKYNCTVMHISKNKLYQRDNQNCTVMHISKNKLYQRDNQNCTVMHISKHKMQNF